MHTPTPIDSEMPTAYNQPLGPFHSETGIKLRALMLLSEWLGEQLGHGNVLGNGAIDAKFTELKEQVRREAGL